MLVIGVASVAVRLPGQPACQPEVERLIHATGDSTGDDQTLERDRV
jgi:hypothetical protein